LLVVRFAVVAHYPWVDPTAAGLVAAAIAFVLTLLVRGGRPSASHDARSSASSSESS